MEPSKLETRIRAYLRKELSPSEHAAFETQLTKDAVLQKAYLAYCLRKGGVKELAMEDRLKEMAESVKAEIGPMLMPQLSLWDHIRFALYRPLFKGLAIVTTLVFTAFLLLLVWVNMGGVEPAKQVPARYLMLPACNINDQEKAGRTAKDALVERNAILQRTKRFYCDGSMDSLQAWRDSFGIADYYVAQLQLKKQDWAAAEKSLEKCMSNPDFQGQFSAIIDFGEIRFNLLLARMGKSGRYESVRDDLKKLISDPSIGQAVRTNAKALRTEMESPLRWFYFR